jgi:hypothetical protein
LHIFSARPSAVWSNWKSNAHTCPGRSARSRLAAVSVVESPSRRRFAFALWDAQPLLTPQALHPLAVHRPAVLAQLVMRTAVSPARMIDRERPQRRSQRGIVLGTRGLIPLGGAVLPNNPACPALADAQAVAKHRDRLTPTGRAYQFPREISFSARFSSA